MDHLQLFSPYKWQSWVVATEPGIQSLKYFLFGSSQKVSWMLFVWYAILLMHHFLAILLMMDNVLFLIWGYYK